MNLKDIKSEWEKFLKGQPINEQTVSPSIYSSWKRSLKNQIDPYYLNETLMLSKEEVAKLCCSTEMEKEYGDIISVLKEMALDMDVIFTLYDEMANIKKILADHENIYQNADYKHVFLRNAAENKLGTNAVCLALKTNKPVQVLGPQHLNYHLHKVNCAAAPIHGVEGKVIGVINVSSLNENKRVEILGLVTSIAKIFNRLLLFNNVVERLAICNISFNEITEHLPKGIVYINKYNEISRYNAKVLDLFNINRNNDPKAVKEELHKYFTQMPNLEEELENREVLIKINNRKRSYLISTKKIFNSQNQEKGNLVMVEDTNKILKLQNTLRGNKAIYTFDSIIGQNDEIERLKSVAEKIAKSSSSVLIYGESGTGKELFSQAIHNASFRKEQPFVAINCGAIPSELIESELFGYEPGAFTGALKGGKLGKLELASGGTLFLDEVESMPLNVQIKLLRALSTGKITRIGGLDEIPIDIRLISATKKDLLKESEYGSFREDLYYRINIITLILPALRERKEDISILAKYFVDLFAKQFGLLQIEIDDEFLEALTYYYWRGNVRELKNVIERTILLLTNERVITINELPKKILDAYKYKRLKTTLHEELKDLDKKDSTILKVAEEIAIEFVLSEENGNITKASERLGISRPTLYKKIYQGKKLKTVKKIYSK